MNPQKMSDPVLQKGLKTSYSKVGLVILLIGLLFPSNAENSGHFRHQHKGHRTRRSSLLHVPTSSEANGFSASLNNSMSSNSASTWPLKRVAEIPGIRGHISDFFLAFSRELHRINTDSIKINRPKYNIRM